MFNRTIKGKYLEKIKNGKTSINYNKNLVKLNKNPHDDKKYNLFNSLINNKVTTYTTENKTINIETNVPEIDLNKKEMKLKKNLLTIDGRNYNPRYTMIDK